MSQTQQKDKKNSKIQGLKIKALKYCSDWASRAMKTPFWCPGIAEAGLKWKALAHLQASTLCLLLRMDGIEDGMLCWREKGRWWQGSMSC